MDLKELEAGIDPNTHWYYRSKKIALHKYFVRQVPMGSKIKLIDFGAGSGFFAIDLYHRYPDRIEKVYLVDIGYSQKELDATRNDVIQKLHFIPEGISDAMILFMDVLEHIEDDLEILKDIRSKIGERVSFFITVPAFQSLWSYHDVYLEHYRRYTLDTMSRLLERAELHIQRKYYLYLLLFPAAYLWRKIHRSNQGEQSDMKLVHPLLNSLLYHYHALEMNFRSWNRLFGLSCAVEGHF